MEHVIAIRYGLENVLMNDTKKMKLKKANECEGLFLFLFCALH